MTTTGNTPTPDERWAAVTQALPAYVASGMIASWSPDPVLTVVLGNGLPVLLGQLPQTEAFVVSLAEAAALHEQRRWRPCE